MPLKREEIRLLIHYDWSSGENPNKIAEKINKVHGEKTVTTSTVYRWINKFKNGEESVKDQPRSGPPRKIDREAVVKAFTQNPTMTSQQLAEQFGYHNTQMCYILKEAGWDFDKKTKKWGRRKEKKERKPKKVRMPEETVIREPVDVVDSNVMASIQSIADAEMVNRVPVVTRGIVVESEVTLLNL